MYNKNSNFFLQASTNGNSVNRISNVVEICCTVQLYFAFVVLNGLFEDGCEQQLDSMDKNNGIELNCCLCVWIELLILCESYMPTFRNTLSVPPS
jgi:hypothetical protein